MPKEIKAIQDAIQSAQSLQDTLVSATSAYLEERKKEQVRKVNEPIVTAKTKRGAWHGDDGLLRAKHLKELAEAKKNENNLVALFALLYVAMSPYIPVFGPINALDAINRSNWLANTLAEAMITGTYHEFRCLTDPSRNSRTDTLKSTVLTENYLSASKLTTDVTSGSGSQFHTNHNYNKPDALRWALLDVREKMGSLERRNFDATVCLFNTKCKETDNADVELQKWEARAMRAALQ